MIGMTEPIVNSYARKSSTERIVFRFSEVLTLLEVFNHFTHLQKMQRHIFVFTLWALFICFCVIPYYSTVSCLASPGISSSLANSRF